MNNTISSNSKCFICKKPSEFQCSQCKIVYYCGTICQTKDWPYHSKTCREPLNIIIEDPKPSPLFPFHNELTTLIKINSTKEQIAFFLPKIHTHRTILLSYLNECKLNAFFQSSNDLLSRYNLCQNYCLHYLLLIKLYITDNNISMSKLTLNTLYKELTDKESLLFKGLKSIFDNFIRKFKRKHTSISSEYIIIGRGIFFSYMNMLSIMIKSAMTLNMRTLYLKFLELYMRVFHLEYQSLYQDKEKKTLGNKGHLYYAYACRYAKDSDMMTAIKFFKAALLECENNSKIAVNSYYNLGLIYFTMNMLNEANEYATMALNVILLNKSWRDSDTNDRLSKIYSLLAEIELGREDYKKGLEYIDEGLKILTPMKSMIDNHKQAKRNSIRLLTGYKLLLELKELTIQKINISAHPETNNITKRYDHLMKYLTDDMIKKKALIEKQYDRAEMYNFFLFLTKLSIYQITLLNKTQPKKVMVNLPIFFSKEFKNTLNISQKAHYDSLKTLSLIRNKVLENINGIISADNIKYDSNPIDNSTNSSLNQLTESSQSKTIIPTNESTYDLREKLKEIQLKFPEDADDDSSHRLFAYEKEYDIHQLRMNILRHINETKIPYEEIDIGRVKSLVHSNDFYMIVNQLSLKMLRKLEKEPDVFCEVLIDIVQRNKMDKIEDNERRLGDYNKMCINWKYMDERKWNTIEEKTSDKTDGSNKIHYETIHYDDIDNKTVKSILERSQQTHNELSKKEPDSNYNDDAHPVFEFSHDSDDDEEEEGNSNYINDMNDISNANDIIDSLFNSKSTSPKKKQYTKFCGRYEEYIYNDNNNEEMTL